MLSQSVVLLSFIYQVSASCAYGTHLVPRAETVPVATFTYDNTTGPLNWHLLNPPANDACAKGRRQSPIVINPNSGVPSVSTTSLRWSVNNYPNGAKFENLGSTVEVIVNGSLVDTQASKTYTLRQCHFHTPSEHRIDDQHYPMEMHCVHESSDKKIAVIGFLLELCSGSSCGEPVLKSLFASVSKIATPGSTTTSNALDFTQLVKKFNGAYRYSGSLTTPPCDEGVEWLVNRQVLSIDLASYLAAKKVMRFNSRYTQNVLGGINLLQNAANGL